MHRFLTHHHELTRTLAEHAIIPCHLCLASHAVGAGVLLSVLTVSAYIASSIYKSREAHANV
ncbi:MAG: hypothetical protein WA003_14765 [Desulfuromonadaceae bacterium]